MNNDSPSIFQAPPPHPIKAIQAWLNDADTQQVIEPRAAALATANREGIASTRIIQTLDISEEGLIFATHANSPKGSDIRATRWGSCVFHWPQIKRQMIVSGNIYELPKYESDKLWKSRPPESHAMSTVSIQSAPLYDESALLQQALKAATSAPLKRPEKWVGYRLSPILVQFWEFSPDRLYKRLKYTLSDRQWSHLRLQP